MLTRSHTNLAHVARSAFYTCGAAWLVLVASAVWAADPVPAQYRDLVSRVPSGANLVMIYNVQKILSSPMGVSQGWDKNLQKAFADGVSRVPPQAEGFVLAAQMDLEYLKPIWEAAAVNLRVPLALEEIAKRRSGTRDGLDGLKAIALPNDTYVVQLDQDTLAAMGPANRQLVLQWVREVKRGSKVSPYLQKAAGYSDEAGTEVILAIDLDGAFAPERIQAYLETKRPLLDQAKADTQEITRLLASVQGARLGIRIKDKPFGKLAIDLGSDITLPSDLCKFLLLEIMSDAGMKIGELSEWKAEVKGKELSLAGYLSESGLRRVFSLVDSPLPSQPPQEPKADENSPTYKKGQMASNSQQQYQAITKMLNDLKQDWRDLKSLSSASLYFDRYANRIEKLPVLNVDPDMLKYRDFVAEQLRAASGSVRTMGIRSNYRQMQAGASADYTGGYAGGYAGYDGYSGGYRSGWYGGNGYAYNYGPGGYAAAAIDNTNAFHAATRAQGAQRRAIRTEEKANMAVDVQTLRSNVIDATNQIRRMMTERYQVEF